MNIDTGVLPVLIMGVSGSHHIARDLIFTGGQNLLAGDVARNVQVGASAFKLLGTVGGNVVSQTSSRIRRV